MPSSPTSRKSDLENLDRVLHEIYFGLVVVNIDLKSNVETIYSIARPLFRTHCLRPTVPLRLVVFLPQNLKCASSMDNHALFAISAPQGDRNRQPLRTSFHPIRTRLLSATQAL